MRVEKGGQNFSALLEEDKFQMLTSKFCIVGAMGKRTAFLQQLLDETILDLKVFFSFLIGSYVYYM